MQITVPEFSLVVLIGASGSGKSTFAQKHFPPTAIVSSDRCRALISDDENNQAVTPEAFQLLRFIVKSRLRQGRLTVVDATNVQSRSRLPLLALARRHDAPCVAIVFDLPEAACLDRNSKRRERVVPDGVIAMQCDDLRHSLPQFDGEGFMAVYELNCLEEIENSSIVHSVAPVSCQASSGLEKGRLRILLNRIFRFL